MPRLLPLLFVAVGGVLAMKAITSLDLVPGAFHAAEAFAADAKKAPAKPARAKAPARAEGAGDAADDPTESYAVNPALMAADANSSASDAAASAPMAPICATSVDDLAKQAGISPNELQILQNLGQRRQQLDQREQSLNSRQALIDVADSKLDTRIQQLSNLKTQIQALLDQANKTQDDDTNRLVAVYSAMKPKDAAAVLSTMKDDVRLPIAAKMKDRNLAAILGAMDPSAARDLTEKLATRMQDANGLQQQLDKAATGGTAAAPVKPAAKPAPVKKS
ncbi:hypothetical protein [Asticcacaulis sp. EMRT-3]|uniref:MotE family protein n=1 Tax=Asticcacaulis sp. EMRT-3 TaxID=3040349 RepID=UPI0024AF72D8|nr:hypothetical protein [Asticcacaulis sp. EMRT-3]MDI7773803.1 hypothetical protein [Asticcacaulis sp. EMRT-3]